jgi:hypothetical protein
LVERCKLVAGYSGGEEENIGWRGDEEEKELPAI